MVGWGGSGEEVALAGVAAGVAERGELGGLFDPFGNDVEIEVVSDADDRSDHEESLGVGLLAELADEGLVDFEEVDREGVQVGERGVLGAEVVERDTDAEALEGVESLVDEGRVGQQGAFGEFEDESGRREPALAERRLLVHRSEQKSPEGV